MDNPYATDAPWPTMRGNLRNSGRLKNLKWKNPGIAPKVIHFRTGNAIFSTPIIDGEERIFVGSADHKFYAFDPHEGEKIWERDVGEIVDSAGCAGKDGTVYVAAGDGKIRAFRPDGTIKWIFDALKQRKKGQFTFSTNYWFEANIVLGPDDAIYIANDDFFLYKISPEGKPLWGFRTGFLIWSACAFGKGGSVYLAGFDHLLYSLDMSTGKLKWKTNLGGSLVSSPVVGEDGTIYQGAFNGKMYAVDGMNGKVKWAVDTGSHIYASPAISLDNILYFGSTNGTFYAIDTAAGKIKWTYYIGDAIRSSASIGPDPEERVPYLIYFGGGDGVLYAIDPNGQLRWSYNTLKQAANTDYPNINASIALGHNGIAVASSTGEVIWVSYDYYRKRDAAGITLGENVVPKEEGVLWHFVSPGGRLNLKSLKTEMQVIDPTNIISLRLLLHEGPNLLPALLEPSSIKLKPTPFFPFRHEVQSDGSTLNIIPVAILQPGTDFSLNISASYVDREGQTASTENTIQVRTQTCSEKTSMLAKKNTVFKIIHMAVPQPRIIPSLDQIGLASLTIPFSVVETDPEKKTFVAWAVHKFGEKGVPQKRITLYAFSGMAEGDCFLMESRKCLFEITSFVMPLDRFRLSGRLQPDGTVAPGSSLLIEKFLGLNLIALFRQIGGSSPVMPGALLKALRMGGLVQFMKAAISFFPALLRQVMGNTWADWGLINHAQKLVGVGTFQMAVVSDSKESTIEGIEVYSFKAEPAKRHILAELKVPARDPKWPTVVGILLLDKSTGKAIPLNYNSALKYRDLKEGKRRIILTIPKTIPLKPNNSRAYLMVDLCPVEKLEF
jgi:outer membrane protein assembly factor BamB